MLAFYWLVALCYHGITVRSQLVATKYGPVLGHVVSLEDGSEVLSFLGVPYAETPDGDLRFMPPEEPEPWEDVLVADTLPDACPQVASNLNGTHPLWDRYSEDCLAINIYTPYNYESPGPYPVLVFYHGGAFSGGANIKFPGHFYASRGVVAVIANYRLGNLGFLGTGDPAFPGNAGMLDMLQVLRYIQENPDAYSADPSRVTIMGDSAGAASVGHLVLSPLAQGLLHRAVYLSGSDLAFWSANSRDVAANLTTQIAANLSCSGDPAYMARCMQGRSVDEIMDAEWDIWPGYVSLGVVPMVGGASGFLPDTPHNMRDAGNFSKVTVLGGTTSNELGSNLLIFEEGLTKEEFRDIIEIAADIVLAAYDQQVIDDVVKAGFFEYTDWPYVDDVIRNRDKLMLLFNDVAFGTTFDQILRSHCTYNATYKYEFGYRSQIYAEEVPEWAGLSHSGDLPYVFGYPLVGDNEEVVDDAEFDYIAFQSWTETDKDFANYWMDMIANFVKTGNPTPQPQPAPPGFSPTTWRPWRLPEANYLTVSNTTISNQGDTRQKNHAFWREYVAWMLARRPPIVGPVDTMGR